ncbi:MAG: hypothetical protein ACK4ZJ_18265, partial [Allorhizobium sp.]
MDVAGTPLLAEALEWCVCCCCCCCCCCRVHGCCVWGCCLCCCCRLCGRCRASVARTCVPLLSLVPLLSRVSRAPLSHTCAAAYHPAYVARVHRLGAQCPTLHTLIASHPATVTDELLARLTRSPAGAQLQHLLLTPRPC